MTTSPHQPLRGILLCVSALFLFACLDTTTKYLSAQYNVPLIVAVRYIVHLLLMVAILAPREGRQLVQTTRTGLVLVRAACLAAASLFLGLAVQRMPIAETTAILFVAPILVVLIAGPLLHEKIGVVGWTAAILGFSGVLLIVRPGSGLDPLGTVFGLCVAVVAAAYQLLSRLLASTERTITLLFYTALVGSILFGLGLPWFWRGQAPSPLQTVLFLSMGVTGGVGHLLFTSAYRHAPASLLAPITYSQLLWAGLLGWIVFGHVPDRITLVGMCIVAISGVMVALKSRIRIAEPLAE